MSRGYQPKNQSFNNLTVMTGNEVFSKDENGKNIKRKDIALVGMVEKDLPNCATECTKTGKTYVLPQGSKSQPYS